MTAPDPARVLAHVRDQPGRSAYAIAKGLGIMYPGKRRVKFDGVERVLYGLAGRGLVRAEEAPRRIAWWPEEGENRHG
jgi:hypothetical protein